MSAPQRAFSWQDSVALLNLVAALAGTAFWFGLMITGKWKEAWILFGILAYLTLNFFALLSLLEKD